MTPFKYPPGSFSAPGQLWEAMARPSMPCLPAATPWQQSEVEQSPAWHKGKCHDSEQHHTPVPARMCPVTSPPWLVAAQPCESTITLQAAWGTFLACATGHWEETYLLISASEMEAAWQEDEWHGMEVGKVHCQSSATPDKAARKGWRVTT